MRTSALQAWRCLYPSTYEITLARQTCTPNESLLGSHSRGARYTHRVTLGRRGGQRQKRAGGHPSSNEHVPTKHILALMHIDVPPAAGCWPLVDPSRRLLNAGRRPLAAGCWPPVSPSRWPPDAGHWLALAAGRRMLATGWP
eukprot:362459-Chlamydomonas_euryale.AAC.1